MIQREPGIRPVPSLWRRLDATARSAFPIVTTIMLLLLLCAPLFLPGQAAMRPAAALACVYFWTVHRPASMSPIAAFAIGLLADLLGQGPIGVFMVGLLACQGIALRWRRVLGRQDFMVEWVAFCGVTLIFAAIVWSFYSLFALALLPLGPVLFQAALAAGGYPILALGLLVAHRGLADPEQA